MIFLGVCVSRHEAAPLYEGLFYATPVLLADASESDGSDTDTDAQTVIHTSPYSSHGEPPHPNPPPRRSPVEVRLRSPHPGAPLPPHPPLPRLTAASSSTSPSPPLHPLPLQFPSSQLGRQKCGDLAHPPPRGLHQNWGISGKITDLLWLSAPSGRRSTT